MLHHTACRVRRYCKAVARAAVVTAALCSVVTVTLPARWLRARLWDPPVLHEQQGRQTPKDLNNDTRFSVNDICNNLPTLQELRVALSTMSDAGLRQVGTGLPRLRALDASMCYRITPACVFVAPGGFQA